MTWQLEQRDAVAVLTFERPPRNVMSFASLGELAARVGELGEREDVSVVVLTGGVPGYFVAHADLEDLGRLGRGEPVEGDPRAWTRTLALLESLPQPVVAAVNGQAHGGGCELALACTLRVAARSAHFAQPEIDVGIIPGAGGTQRLPRLIGPGAALDLVLTGRVVPADEAARLGLVNAVLPDEDFLDEAVTWAGRLAAKPRHALVAAKKAVVEGLRMPLADGLRHEAKLFLACQSEPSTLALQAAVLERYAAAGPDEKASLGK